MMMASCVNDAKVKDQVNAPSAEKGALMLNIGATRTTTALDYVLRIYKNEGESSILVRKYDSTKDEQPQYIWLLEGNYTAAITSGTAVGATLEENNLYYEGEQEFAIVAGETTTVDLVARMQNIPVEVIFDQTVVDGFHSGYYVDVTADSETKLQYTESATGYFIMPEGVTTLTWRFVGTFEYEDGEQVNVDKSGTIENVEQKKSYKLSFKYSKDANGFLGDINVTVDETVEERDDHIAFNPDPEVKGVGFDIDETCNYTGGSRQYKATSPAEFCAVKLYLGDTELNPVANTVAGVVISGMNTAELYITLSDEFFNALAGGLNTIKLYVEDVDGGTASKDLPYNLQGVNVYNKANENLWVGSTLLTATVFGTPSSVQIMYREVTSDNSAEWQYYAATSSASQTYAATVDGVAPGKNYEYNLMIDGSVVGTSLEFTTPAGVQIPNGNLENWCTDSSDVIIPWQSAVNPYWCTGNYGTAILSKNITQSSTDVRPGTTGTKSAYLNSEYIVVKFAAGNIYIGSWGGMNGTNATVYFGQPFTYNAKPKAIRFWAKFNCGAIDQIKGGVATSGDPDLTKIFCCMCNWTAPHTVDSSNADATTFSPSDANIKSGDARYNGVLYSAYMETTTSQSDWKQFEIPFTFYGDDESVVPNYLVLTFTCSGYGDYFDGSTESWMYIDDIEFVY